MLLQPNSKILQVKTKKLHVHLAEIIKVTLGDINRVQPQYYVTTTKFESFVINQAKKQCFTVAEEGPKCSMPKCSMPLSTETFMLL